MTRLVGVSGFSQELWLLFRGGAGFWLRQTCQWLSASGALTNLSSGSDTAGVRAGSGITVECEWGVCRVRATLSSMN